MPTIYRGGDHDRASIQGEPGGRRSAVGRVVMALPEGLGVTYRWGEAEGGYATRRFDRRPTERVTYRRFFLARPQTCLALSEGVRGSSLRRFRGPMARAFRRR